MFRNILFINIWKLYRVNEPSIKFKLVVQFAFNLPHVRQFCSVYSHDHQLYNKYLVFIYKPGQLKLRSFRNKHKIYSIPQTPLGRPYLQIEEKRCHSGVSFNTFCPLPVVSSSHPTCRTLCRQTLDICFLRYPTSFSFDAWQMPLKTVSVPFSGTAARPLLCIFGYYGVTSMVPAYDFFHIKRFRQGTINK